MVDSLELVASFARPLEQLPIHTHAIIQDRLRKRSRRADRKWLLRKSTIDHRSHDYRSALLAALIVSLMSSLGELAFNVGERVSACIPPLFALLVSTMFCLGVGPMKASKTLGSVVWGSMTTFAPTAPLCFSS